MRKSWQTLMVMNELVTIVEMLTWKKGMWKIMVVKINVLEERNKKKLYNS